LCGPGTTTLENKQTRLVFEAGGGDCVGQDSGTATLKNEQTWLVFEAGGGGCVGQVVIGTGNPRVIRDLPGPVPEKTRTPRYGYGFSAGGGTGTRRV
jgi:hypothetical protein